VLNVVVEGVVVLAWDGKFSFFLMRAKVLVDADYAAPIPCVLANRISRT